MKCCDESTLTESVSDIKTSREYKEDPFLLTVTHFDNDSSVYIGKVRRGIESDVERIKVFPIGIEQG